MTATVTAKTIHPFPARMAPDLALERLQKLKAGSVVLDPMSGSGTVVRQASDLGHTALGFDMDPLAVLMSRVWTSPVDDGLLADSTPLVLEKAKSLDLSAVSLPWIDDDPRTKEFIDYWFGPKQIDDLRRLSYTLIEPTEPWLPNAAADVFRIALSRLIITKEQCASLARDTSHSRPHRVATSSDFQVLPAFERSIKHVRRRLLASPPLGVADVQLGDARQMSHLQDASVDAVLTSPPYLNAIDYMRGHRLSLVWLGHRFGDLGRIRSDSIGSERAASVSVPDDITSAVASGMGQIGDLPRKFHGMIERYVGDLYRMLNEIARVLKPNGEATFVVGNSCLRGVFIRNSGAVSEAAKIVGLNLLNEVERELPSASRYLPMTAGSSLAKRMRTETILTFAAA